MLKWSKNDLKFKFNRNKLIKNQNNNITNTSLKF